MAAPTRKSHVALARSMRKAPVSTEQLLWRLLRDRRLAGLKFRRQVPIGRYITDFVCFQHRLIVEADGPLHEQRALEDAQRDAWFEAGGFRVLRFTNAQVHERRDEVLDTVLSTAKKI